jgi:hypothetical protein
MIKQALARDRNQAESAGVKGGNRYTREQRSHISTVDGMTSSHIYQLLEHVACVDCMCGFQLSGELNVGMKISVDASVDRVELVC